MSPHPIDVFGVGMHTLSPQHVILPTGEGTLPQYVVNINGQLFSVAGASSVLRRLTELVQEIYRRNEEAHYARLPEWWVS